MQLLDAVNNEYTQLIKKSIDFKIDMIENNNLLEEKYSENYEVLVTNYLINSDRVIETGSSVVSVISDLICKNLNTERILIVTLNGGPLTNEERYIICNHFKIQDWDFEKGRILFLKGLKETYGKRWE